MSCSSRHANRRFVNKRDCAVLACLLLSHGAGVVCLSHMEGEKRHKRGRGVMSMPMRYRGAGTAWRRQGMLQKASAGGFTPVVAGGTEFPIPASCWLPVLPQARAGIRGRSDGDRSRGLRPPRFNQAGSVGALLASKVVVELFAPSPQWAGRWCNGVFVMTHHLAWQRRQDCVVWISMVWRGPCYEQNGDEGSGYHE